MEILTNATLGLKEEKRSSIREIVRALATKYGSTDTAQITTARRAYTLILQQANKGGVSLKRWLSEWEKVFNRAKALNIAEVQGTPATIEFLSALQRKIAPTWAIEQLNDLYRKDELGLPTLSIEQYGQIFAGIILENQTAKQTGTPAIFCNSGRSQQQKDK